MCASKCVHHSSAANSDLIVIICGLYGLFIASQPSFFFRTSTLRNLKHFNSFYYVSMLMLCMLVVRSFEKFSTSMFIADLRKIQSFSQIAICEELVVT